MERLFWSLILSPSTWKFLWTISRVLEWTYAPAGPLLTQIKIRFTEGLTSLEQRVKWVILERFSRVFVKAKTKTKHVSLLSVTQNMSPNKIFYFLGSTFYLSDRASKSSSTMREAGDSGARLPKSEPQHALPTALWGSMLLNFSASPFPHL